MELVDLISKHCSDLRRHLQGRFTYTSPGIQNEMIAIIGSSIRQQIMEEVRASKVFGSICDETTDVSLLEQLSFCVRYTNEHLQVRERFLGFWECPKTDGKSLFETLSNIFQQLQLSMKNVRAQCYDGAVSMRGRYSGLATLVT